MDRRDESLSRTRRWGSLALASGTLLFGGASLFHPPTVDLRDVATPLAEAAHPGWAVDHWVLLVAITLVHLGLLALHASLPATAAPGKSTLACALAVASLVLWLAIFLFEITGWPVLAKAAGTQGPLQGAAGASFEAVARALWATTLSVGYAAAFLLGLAVALWSAAFAGAFCGSRGFARLGVAGGLYTAAVQPPAAAVPAAGLWLLIPAAAVLGAWLLWTAWLAWSRQGREPKRPS